MANPLFHLIFAEFLPFTDYTGTMMKYEAQYEEFVKRYKEPEDGNFADATREILEAVLGDSNIGDDEEMETVAAIAARI